MSNAKLGKLAYDAYWSSALQSTAYIAWESLSKPERTRWTAYASKNEREAMSEKLQDKLNERNENDAWWNARQSIVRTKFLMERLLGWECFISWEDYQRKYGAQEYGLVKGVAFTTPTHVAFCEHWKGSKWEYRVFSPDHEDLKSFNPTQSVDDVWVLIRALAEQKDVYRDGSHTEDVFFQSIRTSGDENGQAIFDLKDFAALTPEKLLDVVYRAVMHIEGKEVEE